MTTTTESKPTRHARPRPHVPRPLPVWLQVGVVLLLLVNGVQAAFHVYSGQGSRVAQTPPSTAPQLRYDYNPYGRASGNLSPAFQYAATYAHAPSAMSVTPMRAYAASTGRWVDRDPLPAK